MVIRILKTCKSDCFSLPFVSGFSAEDCKMDIYISFDCPDNTINEINTRKFLIFSHIPVHVSCIYISSIINRSVKWLWHKENKYLISVCICLMKVQIHATKSQMLIIKGFIIFTAIGTRKTINIILKCHELYLWPNRVQIEHVQNENCIPVKYQPFFVVAYFVFFN